MKKTLLTLCMLLASFATSFAASPFLEFQPLIAGSGTTSFNVQGGVMQQVHPAVAVGVGVGITEHWNFNEGPLIPLFARGEFSFKAKGLSPYVSMDLGYEINTEDSHWGAVLVNPMIGLKFGRWYGGVGYLAHCWTPKHASSSSNFNMKIGYTF